MASSESQIDKPQRGRPKRAELPDVNINTAELLTVYYDHNTKCLSRISGTSYWMWYPWRRTVTHNNYVVTLPGCTRHRPARATGERYAIFWLSWFSIIFSIQLQAKWEKPVSLDCHCNRRPCCCCCCCWWWWWWWWWRWCCFRCWCL